MVFQSLRDRPWRRLGIATLAAALALHAPLAPSLAKVKGRRAVLVVDANTGRVLYQKSADALRYPASLTKLMSLYLIFELIEAGRLNYRTKIRFSANAVAAPPSRLGVKEGTEIDLIEAIKLLITKSANDVAVAVAEHIAGSEERFAQLMTRKARQLGMKNTTFRNASGLPDSEQVTTARDMITLALRLQDDFPKRYPLFATRKFTYGDKTYRNHNRLLFNYKGTDGIKTGYIRAAGFNLVASVRRGGKHVVAALFGGKTSRRRNRAMRKHLDKALRKASTSKTRRPPAPLTAQEEASPSIAAARAAQRPPERSETGETRVRPVSTSTEPAVTSALQASTSIVTPEKGAAPPTRTAAGAGPAGAFHVQVGAFYTESEAERQLALVRQRAATVLGGHAGLTTRIRRGDKTFYRARYGGFPAQETAAVVCSELKRLSIDCLVMKAE